MTDTEAKALALVNEIEVERYSIKRMPEIRRKAYILDEALCRAIERLEAPEARHAAELREQAERFSEAAVRAVRHMARTCFAKGSPCQLEREAIVEGLTDFIIPAPDPLVEALDAAVKAYIAEHGIQAFKALPFFGSTKIGEAGE